jgi:transposase-like protein
MEETDTTTERPGTSPATLLEEKLILDAAQEAYQESQTKNQQEFNLPMTCPKCGNTHGQWRGYRTRKNRTTAHRRWCRSCGKWFQTTTQAITLG